MKIQINNKQNVFFCSDPHYGHGGIVRGTSKWESGYRDFDTIEEHDNTLVNNINKTVGEDDILFCLGDWSFGSYKTNDNVLNIRRFRERLNVKKIYLILGNHDQEIRKMKDELLVDCFELILPYLEIIIIENTLGNNIKAVKQPIVLSHYSHRVWNGNYRGSFMLFGHSHGNLIDVDGKTMDVGFDAHPEFRPYSYQEIKAIMDTKEIQKVDHH